MTHRPICGYNAAPTPAPPPVPAAAVLLRSHFLDVDLNPIYGGLPFLDQLLGSLFALECDESEVLWFVILALVHGADHLCHWTELSEMRGEIVAGDALAGKVSHIDLALLSLSLLAGYLLTLHNVGLLSGGRLQASHLLEDDKCKPTGAPGVRVRL